MGPRTIDRLVFVYDADSGKWGAFVDSARKLLMIKGCALCSITHGMLGERAEWRECKAELGVPIDYRHRDELAGEMRRVAAERLPCILAEVRGAYEMLVGPEVFGRCGGSVAELKGKIEYYARVKDLVLPRVALPA